MNYDLHIHTHYCGHAENMTTEAILKKADEVGLDTICITDHIFRQDDINIPQRIGEEVAQHKTKCRVFIGAEIDVDGLYDDGRLVVDVPKGLDYVIAGLHYLPNDGTYIKNYKDNHLSAEETIKRWEKTLMGVLKNPDITTLAHPGRMISMTVNFDEHFDTIIRIFAQAAAVSAQRGLLWEVNELDKRCIPEHYFDYWCRIYRTAVEAGVKLIYGSDSHHPQAIGKCDFVNRILSALDNVKLQTPESISLI